MNIMKIHAENNLIDLIIESCRIYKEMVGKSSNIIKDDNTLGEIVFVGKIKHRKNLEERFRFLEFILKHGGEEIQMRNENIEKLWNIILCNPPVITFDAEIFLKWISAEKIGSVNKAPVPLFNPKENIFLFELICKNKDILLKKFGMEYLKCFLCNFKLINLEKAAVDIIKGKVKIQQFKELYGIDQIWEIACKVESDNEKIRQKASEMLIEIHLNLSENIKEKRSDIYKEFVDKCMQRIMIGEKEHNQRLVHTIIKILVMFYESLDGSKYKMNEESEETSWYARHKYSIKCILKPGIRNKKVI